MVNVTVPLTWITNEGSLSVQNLKVSDFKIKGGKNNHQHFQKWPLRCTALELNAWDHMCGILFRFLTLLVPSCRIFQHQFLGPPQAFFFSQVVLLERAPGNGTRVLRKEPLLFREGVQCKNYGIQFGSASRVVYHLAPAEAEVSLWGKPLDLGTELKMLDLGYRYDLCF